MKKRRNARVIVLMLILSMLAMPFVIEQPVKKSRAVTTATEVKQLDAGFALKSETDKEGTYYVKIGWKGTGANYCVYQILADKKEVQISGGIAPIPDTESGAVSGGATVQKGINSFETIVADLNPASVYSFKIYESDVAGKKINASDTGSLLEGVKTIPAKLQKPTLIKVYKNLKDAEFSYRKDGYSDSYQVRAETLKGKKLTVKDITSEAASGSAAVRFSMKPYTGMIVCVKVRGVVNIGNGEKRYGEWSDTVEYGYAKKIKLSGKKDTIKVSGLKVDGAAKKAIYVSLKKNKGYKLAKKVGAKTKSTKISKYGKKYVQSKKTYYIRVYYYYKVDGKLKKSPVYDQDMVFVKPAISYIRVE